MFESVDARMDAQAHQWMDRRRLESHPISSSRAFGSGELKMGEYLTVNRKVFIIGNFSYEIVFTVHVYLIVSLTVLGSQ